MTPEEIAAQALADLEAKSEAHLAAVRAHAAAAKTRLEQGVLNLRTQAESAAAVEPEVVAGPAWDFGMSDGADLDAPSADFPDAPDLPDAPPGSDGHSAFSDAAFDVATDDDGIPLGE